MTKAAQKLRISIAAPTQSTGGITTWLKTIVASSDSIDWTVFDTSRALVLGAAKTPRVLVREAVQDVGRAWVLWQAWRSGRFDAAYLTSAPGLGLLIRDIPQVVIARGVGLPLVIHLHGGDLRAFLGSPWRRSLVLWGLDRATLVITITPDVQRFLAGSLQRTRVEFLPNPVPESLLLVEPVAAPLTHGPLQIVHVAWQAPAKGSLVAVAALVHLPDRYQLRLVGQADTHNRSEIVDFARRLGVADRVHLAGNLPWSEAIEEMQRACVLVLPSHSEGFPMVVAEAMALGLPVVATDVGAIRHMLVGSSGHPGGLLLSANDDPRMPCDPADLAGAIVRACAPSQWTQLAQSARDRAGEFCVDVVVPQLERLLRDVVRISHEEVG